jgi:membrane-bound lytic murein transglycosylase D
LKVKPGMMINVPKFTAPSTGKTTVAKSKKDNIEARPAQEERVARNEKIQTQAKQSEPKQQPQNPVIHVVKKGETLASISSKYNMDVAELKAANNLKGNKVTPDMKLKLASQSQKKSAQKKAPVKYHVVKKGETLSSISNKYNVDMADIKMANNLKNDKVTPKMKLKILSGEG